MKNAYWVVCYRAVNDAEKLAAYAVLAKPAVEAAGGSVELSIDGSFLGDVPEVAIAVFGETPYAEGAGDLSTLEYQPGS